MIQAKHVATVLTRGEPQNGLCPLLSHTGDSKTHTGYPCVCCWQWPDDSASRVVCGIQGCKYANRTAHFMEALSILHPNQRMTIGVLFGCFGKKIDGPGLLNHLPGKSVYFPQRAQSGHEKGVQKFRGVLDMYANKGQGYYRLSVQYGNIDNPDQRIAQDIGAWAGASARIDSRVRSIFGQHLLLFASYISFTIQPLADTAGALFGSCPSAFLVC